MSTTTHRLTRSQRTEVRKCLRDSHRDWVTGHITQARAADILTQRLGFIVTRAHIGRISRALRLRWPYNPRPHRGPRTPSPNQPVPTIKRAGKRAGKLLSPQAIDDLRYMANGLLEYAAAIEFIINTGHPSTTEK